MYRKGLAVFFVFSLGLFTIFSGLDSNAVSARSLSEIRSEKAVVEKKKAEKKRELNSVIEEQKKARQELDRINSEMESTSKKIIEKQDEIAKTRGEIDQLNNEIAEVEKRIEERDKLLKERVRSMHVNGGAVSYLEVLLGAKSFGEFLDRVLALNAIAEQDRALLEEQKADMQLLEEKKQQVEEKLHKIENELADLEALKKDLTAQLNEKDRLMAQLKLEEEHLHDELGEIENKEQILKAEEAAFIRQQKEAEERRKAEEARKKAAAKGRNNGSANVSTSQESEQSPSYSSSSGFIMPTSGVFTSPYGQRKGRLHAGIDIANQKGTSIRAAASGTVIFAGRMNGYGNTVMITHSINGKKYTTLYAHLNTISVRQGQSVSQGQHIGGMGNTGNVWAGPGGDGTHLHFEIHPGGYRNPVNPMNYL